MDKHDKDHLCNKSLPPSLTSVHRIRVATPGYSSVQAMLSPLISHVKTNHGTPRITATSNCKGVRHKTNQLFQ